MTLSIHDELDTLYDKFDHAERKWLNRFDELNDRFEIALRNFTINLPTGGGAPSGAQDTLDIGSNVVLGGLGLSGAPGVLAVPIVLGLKKLATLVDGAEVKPPEPDVLSMKNQIKEMQRSFKKATEYLGDEIIRLKDRAARSASNSDVQAIRSSISQILLSPIWYPPASSVTQNPGLAGALEMRLWFNYFDKLVKLAPAHFLPMTGRINFSPMWKRFKDVGWEPQGVSIVNMSMMGRPNNYLPKGDQYSIIKIVQQYGNKHRELKLQHSYPAAVQQYIAVSKGVNALNGFLGRTTALPASNLGWADASLN